MASKTPLSGFQLASAQRAVAVCVSVTVPVSDGVVQLQVLGVEQPDKPDKFVQIVEGTVTVARGAAPSQDLAIPPL